MLTSTGGVAGRSAVRSVPPLTAAAAAAAAAAAGPAPDAPRQRQARSAPPPWQPPSAGAERRSAQPPQPGPPQPTPLRDGLRQLPGGAEGLAGWRVAMRAAVPVLRGAVAALLVIAAVAPLAAACVAESVTVSPTFVKPAKPIEESAFDHEGVVQHFDSLAVINDYRPNIKSTFSCIDSRGEADDLGTPGGDFAELAAAIAVYLNTINKSTAEYGEISDIFNAFMRDVVSKERPFYYHTSDEKLRKVFHALGDKGVKPKPTVLPTVMPDEVVLRNLWLDALSEGHVQGCGHVRLMMEKYAEYGLKSDEMPRQLIKAFYNFFWHTPIGSAERQKINYSVMQGALAGEAIAVVESKGECAGWSPAMPPSHGGSQAFVFHQKAAEDFRNQVVAPFFVNYAKSKGQNIDLATFQKNLQSLQAQHLAATLKYLEPANALPIWPVTINTKQGNDSAPLPMPNVAPSGR
ncbi:hypothetical protein Rsub_02376 [Raphidocelis subcapitata]|uniref:Uncharacterized protein n=1 Tax=Raphidocelis subcapitata TaxID=307507 RepID=A0A2V0NXF9_9CHLO|nr:hypothetical protein Rsub_02376 [Raphidocelis subcapitata]|eukprot:GBF90270.1 hypothetical protein Rsub_02376 [Raphidocelis subcapitata]